jgi:Pyridoxal-dependent decarboxylase, C-terminal sheet domain
MFDHASVRPRILGASETIKALEEDGFMTLQASEHGDEPKHNTADLFASTVFGPTCDSIDVIARSVLLPKLKVGDWMYFNNMGAYTMAAASSFNGFVPSERFYVCSVQPEYFEAIIEGPDASGNESDGSATEEKKEEE